MLRRRRAAAVARVDVAHKEPRGGAGGLHVDQVRRQDRPPAEDEEARRAMLIGNHGLRSEKVLKVAGTEQRIKNTLHCSNLLLNSKTKSEASEQRGIKNLTFSV